MKKLLAQFIVGLVALFTLLVPASLAAQSPAEAAIQWARGQQLADGSFPGFGPGDSADMVVALAAAGIDPASVAQNGVNALDYLAVQAPSYATSVGATAKLTLAAVAGGVDPRQFGGVNLLSQLGAGYDVATGQYGADLYSHLLALLAIQSVGATPPPAAIQRSLDLQLADGGWSFDGTAASGSDTNTTALAIQALAPFDVAATARQRGLGYLRSQQNADGGFPYSQASSFGTDSDANSTAAVLQALAAAGESPADWAASGGNSPVVALSSLQNGSGALRYQAALADDNPLATYQAILGLLGAALPVATTSIDGAQALIAPVSALPATSSGASLPLEALFASGLLAIAAGWMLRQTSRHGVRR